MDTGHVVFHGYVKLRVYPPLESMYNQNGDIHAAIRWLMGDLIDRDVGPFSEVEGFSHCLSRMSFVHRSIVWGVVHLSTTNNLTNKVAGNHEKGILGGVYSQQMPTVYIYNLSLSKHKQFLGIRKFQGEHYIFSQPWDLGDSCPIFRAISADIRTYSMFPCLAYVLTQPWLIPSRPFPHLRFSLHLKAQTPQLAQA